MAKAKPKAGFKVNGTFYPLVTVDDWRNGDFILARDITHLSSTELFSGKADYLTVQMALLAVAVQREQPELAAEHVASFVASVKPSQVVEVGFDSPADGESGPPAEAPQDGASESSGTGSDPG